MQITQTAFLPRHFACGCHPQPDQPESAGDSVVLTEEEPPSPNVQVRVYPQDPYVSGPVVMDFERNKIGEDLAGSRVRIVDRGRTKVEPDENGNYLPEDGTTGLTQVNAHAMTYKTLDLIERYRGSKIDWAFNSDTLEVVPHKQQGRNAYYSRWEQSTNFFYFDSPGLGAHVKTANSTDIVAHEVGHAILDGLRPGFFGTSDLETGAFHESFGDCVAMLLTLDESVNHPEFFEQTGGSLRYSNVLSNLAEEFGAAIKADNDNPDDDHKTYLRSSLNSFTYVDPSELPPGRGDDDNLGRQVHSFSRVFSGAFYDVLESIYMQAIYDERQCPEQALKTAAEVAGPALIRAIETGSATRARFKEIALGMVAADQVQNGGQYTEVMKKAFLAREIVTPEDFEQDPEEPPSLRLEAPVGAAGALSFAAAHADELGIPADLNVLGVSRTREGEQVLTFNYIRELPVTGIADYQGYTTDLQGGVTMVFGKDGAMTRFLHTPLDQEAISREMEGIAELKGSNSILERDRGDNIFTSQDGQIFKAVVRGKKLVRVPISSCHH